MVGCVEGLEIVWKEAWKGVGKMWARCLVVQRIGSTETPAPCSLAFADTCPFNPPTDGRSREYSSASDQKKLSTKLQERWWRETGIGGERKGADA